MWYASKVFLRMTFIEVNYYFKEKEILQPKELNKHKVSRTQGWFNTRKPTNIKYYMKRIKEEKE